MRHITTSAALDMASVDIICSARNTLPEVRRAGMFVPAQVAPGPSHIAALSAPRSAVIRQTVSKRRLWNGHAACADR